MQLLSVRISLHKQPIYTPQPHHGIHDPHTLWWPWWSPFHEEDHLVLSNSSDNRYKYCKELLENLGLGWPCLGLMSCLTIVLCFYCTFLSSGICVLIWSLSRIYTTTILPMHLAWPLFHHYLAFVSSKIIFLHLNQCCNLKNSNTPVI